MTGRTILYAALVAALALPACGRQKASNVTAPPPPARSLKSPGCSSVTYGGPGRPQFLIAASTTLQGQFTDHGVQAAQALKLALAKRRWRAGPYRVGLQVCDETTAKSDFSDPRKCRSNARAFADNRAVLAVVGPIFSSCAAQMLPILDRVRGGPLAVVGASTTYLGLTRGGPGVGPAEPAVYYPRKLRNFIRLVPADDVQGAAAAIYVKKRGASRAFVLTDKDPYGEGLGAAFRTAAGRIGLTVAGTRRWRPNAHDYRALAAHVRAARPDAVLLAGYAFENAARLLKDVRAALPKAQIIGGDGMYQAGAIAEGAGAAAENFAATIAIVPATALPPAGRAFANDFRRRFGAFPCCFSVAHAEAAGMVLDAIATSRGSRRKVLASLLHARVNGGLTGDFYIDRFGDTSLTRMGVYRVVQGKTHFDAAISPPANLLSRR
ncbi:MAG: branched-chain amino acid ABC transporter substrate-binding protein [Thermoleophilaceae bacterium]